MRESILITGGTGVFGREYVRHFLTKGWDVVVTTTNKVRASQLFEAYPENGSLTIIESDLLKPNAVAKLSEDIAARGITLNHIVNNARSLSTLGVDPDGVIDRNNFINEHTLGVVIPYELATVLLKKQSEALKTITNISSQYGNVAVNPALYDVEQTPAPLHYGVVKAGLNHLTKELAIRLAPYSIRVNGIAYGGVEGRTDADFKLRYARLCPMGRMLQPAEVVGPLDFLTSTASSAVTGHILNADGGWSVW